MSVEVLKLSDYSQPNFWIPHLDLTLDIYEGRTIVTSKMQLEKNSSKDSSDLTLQGISLKLISVAVNGQDHTYKKMGDGLLLSNLPDSCELIIINEIVPESNTALEGLYKSASGFYCTQCEAEGFRRITYFLDRPDVMTKYKTTLIADKGKYPILLSNGNQIAQKDLESGRHLAVWSDPFPKPCYLFAAVAGNLDKVDDVYKTKSGRDVALSIFTDKGRSHRTQWAMESLKQSMKWDEDTYGLEYDLDVYMIVAVDDFNMGAMENKGLNIFNSRCVLADRESATDNDFERIEAIIGHEYFHNWTGNRVTCRDWFQLSLKEGLTVYRDQEFTSDMTSRSVKRIKDVRDLREGQFVEDAGPNAHPVRPRTCVSVDNFYTSTIYEKGAELIRMLEVIVGKDKFKQGLELYFKRFDGQAVTTEDFMICMQDISGIDLTQFKMWYDQAGTPNVSVSSHWDFDTKVITLNFRQNCRETPETQLKQPYLIPVQLGFVGRNGQPISFTREDNQPQDSAILCLDKVENSYAFKLSEEGVPSLFRNFSAPVNVSYDYSNAELLLLMSQDSDPFNRWESSQKILMSQLLKIIHRANHINAEEIVDQNFLEAFRSTISEWDRDILFSVEILTLPAESYISQFLEVIDPVKVDEACKVLARAIAEKYENEFNNIYEKIGHQLKTEAESKSSKGLRSMRSTALWYLNQTQKKKYLQLAQSLFQSANNMTETMAALNSVNMYPSVERTEAINQFYDKWKLDTVVFNKWLAFKAQWADEEGFEWISHLKSERHFDLLNPNNVYASFGVFAGANLMFHDSSGKGYQLICDIALEVDSKNAQVAAGLFEAFSMWKKYEPGRRDLMKQQLSRALQVEGLSKNSYEIISRSLS